MSEMVKTRNLWAVMHTFLHFWDVVCSTVIHELLLSAHVLSRKQIMASKLPENSYQLLLHG